ncbi:hypothetical protein ABPG75_004549 [Micractinium tetrahymenae]
MAVPAEAGLAGGSRRSIAASSSVHHVFLQSNRPALTRTLQVYLLGRLATGDLATSKLLLHAVARAMEKMSDKSIPEFAPFGFTLALRMQHLLKSGRCEVKDGLWQLAVDQVLVKLVDSVTQAHEEVLRLLLAAAPKLDAMELSNYLTRTLNNSKKSRKRFKKRKLFESYDGDGLAGGYGSAGGYASASDYGGGGYSSAGGTNTMPAWCALQCRLWRSSRQRSSRHVSGRRARHLRTVCQVRPQDGASFLAAGCAPHFAVQWVALIASPQRCPVVALRAKLELTPAIAPKLFEYLGETAAE